MSRYKTLFLLILGILTLFIGRTLLATAYPMPRLAELFDAITVVGSIVVCVRGYRHLRKRDWVVAIALGALLGIGMCFATLFTPYPVFGMIKSNATHALLRGTFTTLATLGGLVIMRQGGPVQFTIADNVWRTSGKNILLGLLTGLPLAIVNVFALQLSQGRAISWQNPFTAMLDAVQPAIFEEVIYRFAFLGLLWLILRRSIPEQAPWLSGVLALLVHNFAHFDDLFLQAPLIALGMGSVMAVVWGLPPTILALRKDLESAVAFHWIQDVARFLTGF